MTARQLAHSLPIHLLHNGTKYTLTFGRIDNGWLAGYSSVEKCLAMERGRDIAEACGRLYKTIKQAGHLRPRK